MNDIQSTIAAFDELRSDYNVSKDTRFRRTRAGIRALGSSADYHYRNERQFLKGIETARDMDRNDMLLGSMFTSAVNNTIQGGISPEPDTGDADLDRALKTEFDSWAGDADLCDRAGEMTFTEMQLAAFRAMLVDGDVVAIPDAATGALEHIEAHRLRTPENATRRKTAAPQVIHGVEIDRHRRRLRYYITKADLAADATLKNVADTTPVPVRIDGRRVLFHLYSPHRVSQTRGVTAIARIIDPAAMFEDIQLARLVQQQLVSNFGYVKKKGAGRHLTGALGQQADATKADGAKRPSRVIAHKPGWIEEIENDESIDVIRGDVPPAEFFEHIELTMQIISINLGLPLMVALLDGSKTNFSGGRMALEMAKIGWRRNQATMIKKYINPIYRWRVRAALNSSRAIRAAAARQGANLYAANYNPPTWPYIQPLQDAKADELKADKWLNSRRRIQAERGRVWADLAGEIVDDNVLLIRHAIDAATKINDETGAGLTWLDVLTVGDASAASPLQLEGEGRVAGATAGKIPLRFNRPNRLADLVADRLTDYMQPTEDN